MPETLEQRRHASCNHQCITDDRFLGKKNVPMMERNQVEPPACPSTCPQKMRSPEIVAHDAKPLAVLLRSQGDQWIYSCGAARWDHAPDHGYGGNY
jgi:hypothetical protein